MPPAEAYTITRPLVAAAASARARRQRGVELVPAAPRTSPRGRPGTALPGSRPRTAGDGPARSPTRPSGSRASVPRGAPTPSTQPVSPCFIQMPLSAPRTTMAMPPAGVDRHRGRPVDDPAQVLPGRPGRPATGCVAHAAVGAAHDQVHDIARCHDCARAVGGGATDGQGRPGALAAAGEGALPDAVVACADEQGRERRAGCNRRVVGGDAAEALERARPRADHPRCRWRPRRSLLSDPRVLNAIPPPGSGVAAGGPVGAGMV